MPGMGPPPKDPSKRARRNAPTVVGTQLPAEGRPGPAPRWPFAPDPRTIAETQHQRANLRKLRKQFGIADPGGAEHRRLAKDIDAAEFSLRVQVETAKQTSRRQRELWAQLWKSPQSVMWERMSAISSVAMYVRAQVAGELGDEKQAKEARYRETDLGLNPKGMQNLRWTIAAKAEAKAARSARSASRASGSRARRGPLTAVPDLPKAAGDD